LKGTPVLTEALQTPLFKWTGGKRWLVEYVESTLPSFARYHEPFVGGGALFFGLRPRCATLADANGELVNAYVQIRDNPQMVARMLRTMKIERDAYGVIRNSRPRSAARRAARFVYLNRTAFNGIYRVNRHGIFNVPFGCKPSTSLPDLDMLLSASVALKGVRLYQRDFARSIAFAKPKDLIYVDPPYVTHHNNNGFRRYNEEFFSWEDQKRLAECCMAAAKRGVFVLVSNAAHNEVLALYSGFGRELVSRRSAISADPRGRTHVKECILRSWK